MDEIPFNDPVIGHYFGIFYGKEDFERRVDGAPFDKMNLLLIAFVHTYEETSGSETYVAKYEREDAPERIQYLIGKARAKNPKLKMVLSLGWGHKDYELAVVSPGEFAASAKKLVHAHGLDGFDLDYEYARREARVGPGKMSVLVQALRKELPRGEKLLTITPAETDGLNGDILRQFDLVMPQSYKHGGNGTVIGRYVGTGYLSDYSRIVVGMNSEPGEFNNPKAPPDKADDFVRQHKEKKTAGVFAWRLCNDNSVMLKNKEVPTYLAATQMFSLIHGSFDDTPIVRALEYPHITKMLIRSYEVLDAVQITKVAALSGGARQTIQTKSDEDFVLPRHGGGGGNETPVVIPDGDPIVEVTGHTGAWRDVDRALLQITIKTKKGETFGPYGSMNAAKGDKKPLLLKAPAGQAIVGFKGTTVYSKEAGHPPTGDLVIASLEAVYADLPDK